MIRSKAKFKTNAAIFTFPCVWALLASAVLAKPFEIPSQIFAPPTNHCSHQFYASPVQVSEHDYSKWTLKDFSANFGFFINFVDVIAGIAEQPHYLSDFSNLQPKVQKLIKSLLKQSKANDRKQKTIRSIGRLEASGLQVSNASIGYETEVGGWLIHLKNGDMKAAIMTTHLHAGILAEHTEKALMGLFDRHPWEIEDFDRIDFFHIHPLGDSTAPCPLTQEDRRYMVMLRQQLDAQGGANIGIGYHSATEFYRAIVIFSQLM